MKTLFFLVLSLAVSALAALPPGKILDLSNFVLQIPVDKGGGSITTISQPELNTYSSQYFYTDPNDNTVVMWAPENGVVTGNGAGPRTELTEPHDYFTFSGRHVMKFTQQVQEANPTGKLCIGQIKGDSFSGMQAELNSTGKVDSPHASCLIVVEYIYNADKKEAEAHMRDKNCNSVVFSLGKFGLNEKIITTFVVDGYDVYVSSNKKALPPYSYAFWKGKNYGMHFKVGAYDQGTGGSHTKGGKTKLSDLHVSHSK